MSTETEISKLQQPEAESHEGTTNGKHPAAPQLPPPGPCLTQEEAVKRILKKNAELFRRLAQ